MSQASAKRNRRLFRKNQQLAFENMVNAAINVANAEKNTQNALAFFWMLKFFLNVFFLIALVGGVLVILAPLFR